MRIGVWGGDFVRRTIALAADLLGDVTAVAWLPDDSNPLADDAFDLLVIGTDILVAKAQAGEAGSETAPSFAACLQVWSQRLQARGATTDRPPVLLVNFAISPDAAPGLRYVGMDLASDIPNVFSAGPLPLLSHVGASPRPDARQARQMLGRALRDGLANALRARPSTESEKLADRERQKTLNEFPPSALADPLVRISVMIGEPECGPECENITRLSLSRLQNYFATEDPSFKRDKPAKNVSAIIDLKSFSGFDDFYARLKKISGGARIRQANKAARTGMFCERFNPRLFLPDIYEINTSKEFRNGRPMSDVYRKTVEQMGGYPTRRYPLVEPTCPWHWSLYIGAFMPAPGHKQGEIVVDKRLVAYIMLVRRGEYVTYSNILGHGDVLDIGAMSLLHHETMRWIMNPDNPYTRRLRLVFYAGADPGGAGLRDWKKREMFTRARIAVVRDPAPVN